MVPETQRNCFKCKTSIGAFALAMSYDTGAAVIEHSYTAECTVAAKLSSWHVLNALTTR